jgi:hypothetical protein
VSAARALSPSSEELGKALQLFDPHTWAFPATLDTAGATLQIQEAGSELGHAFWLLNALLALMAQLWAQESMSFQVPISVKGISALTTVEIMENLRMNMMVK